MSIAKHVTDILYSEQFDNFYWLLLQLHALTQATHHSCVLLTGVMYQ